MKEIFEYLLDKVMYLQHENRRLEDEHYAICKYLREKGIDLVIERNKIHELKEGENNEL